MKFLGDRIRELRNDFDVKQDILAKELVIKQNTLSQYENNKRTPSIETIIKIADYFEVSLDYLIGITDILYNPSDSNFKSIMLVLNKMTKEEKSDLIKNLKNKYK